MSLTNFWPQRRNLLLAVMEFRTAFTDVWKGWVRGFCFARTNMCQRVVLFLRILPKVEPCLFPSPPTSTTMEELWDHRSPCAIWRFAIAIARYSPQLFVEAFTGTPWDAYTSRRDGSHPDKWLITFLRSRLCACCVCYARVWYFIDRCYRLIS